MCVALVTTSATATPLPGSATLTGRWIAPNMELLVLRMVTPAASIAGRAFDAEGKPVAKREPNTAISVGKGRRVHAVELRLIRFANNEPSRWCR
jgi:hypothetical protein